MKPSILSISILACAASVAATVRMAHREETPAPTLTSMLLDSVARDHSEEDYHGMLLGIEAWDRAGWYHRSFWMAAPPGWTSELDVELEERRENNQTFAGSLDAKIAWKWRGLVSKNPLAVWAQAERVFLAPYSNSLEQETEAAWNVARSFEEGTGRPVWAVGRYGAFLTAKVRVEALGLATLMESRTRDTQLHERWMRRATELLPHVAAIDERVFAGAWPFDAREYPSRVRMARRAMGWITREEDSPATHHHDEHCNHQHSHD